MQKVRSSGSYPDLLEMVTRSGSPSSRDHAGMYAKVGGVSMYANVGGNICQMYTKVSWVVRN